MQKRCSRRLRRKTGQSKSTVIVVADSGPGISSEMMETIMLVYEERPESSGQGLGLAIFKQLVEQYGMRLEIGSIQGEGTCCRAIFILRV